jgi:hypothetical protein
LADRHADRAALDGALCLNERSGGGIKEIGKQGTRLAWRKKLLADNFVAEAAEMRFKSQD